MAFFGNDYGRYRTMNRGYDRGMMGSRRGNWNHLEAEGDRMRIRGYDSDQFRGARQDWATEGGMGYDRMGYDRGYGYRGANRGMWNTTYDRDYGATGGYDQGYKGNWETDYGDPFGDRESRTPMRVINGEYHGGNDRMYGSNMGYDRNYSGYANNPATYDPYYGGGRTGTWNRGYDRGYRMNNRGYDAGWY